MSAQEKLVTLFPVLAAETFAAVCQGGDFAAGSVAAL